jgi:hypothetical protein
MQNLRIKRRKDLKIKMAQVFNEEIKMFPKEMRDILVDDLVTAFENRLMALQRRRIDTEMQLLIANVERYEVLQTS